MSVETTVRTKCDVCGKAHAGGRLEIGWTATNDTIPPDPWVTVEISGHWINKFGRAAKTDGDACSTKCAIEMLKKVIEKLERVGAMEERIDRL